MNNRIDKNMLEKIDCFLDKNGCRSMTSKKYRNDLLYFLANNADNGQYVCEVGPYKGGLTANLAYVCSQLGKKLIVCEIDQENADIVKNNLNKLGYIDFVQIYVMSFVDFVAKNRIPSNTIITIIDANHIYPYALQNFQALMSVKNNSYAVAFHDFGLRDIDNIMGVERAVREVFLGDTLYYIGDNSLFKPCELHTTPAEDKTFFRGSEGALIILSSKTPYGITAIADRQKKLLPLFIDKVVEKGQHALEHAFKKLTGSTLKIRCSKAERPKTINFDLTSLTYGTFGCFFTLEHDTGVGKAIRETGCWGIDHVQLFERIVRKGDIVFDVGANIGHHSVCLARIVGPQGRVFSFEPQLPLFYTLCANAMINACTNIYPFRAVVGEKAGTVVLPVINYMQDLNFGAMCVKNNEQDNNNIKIIKFSIDEFANDKMNAITSINFIKIDVQTFELFVLQGMQKVIEKYRPHLFIEISPYWMNKINGYDYREIYLLLQNMGYLIFTPTFSQEQNIPDFPLDESSREIEWDILAVHKYSALARELC